MDAATGEAVERDGRWLVVTKRQWPMTMVRAKKTVPSFITSS